MREIDKERGGEIEKEREKRERERERERERDREREEKIIRLQRYRERRWENKRRVLPYHQRFQKS